MTWLGLDLGTERTGVALSTSGVLATPWELVTGTSDEQIEQILHIIRAEQVTTVVTGKISRTRPTPLADFDRQLTARLQTFEPPIRLVRRDETLTTKEAERRHAGQAKTRRASDSLAALVLLEDYLSALREIEDKNANR